MSANFEVVFNLLPIKWALLFLKTLLGPGGGTVFVPKFNGDVPTELEDWFRYISSKSTFSLILISSVSLYLLAASKRDLYLNLFAYSKDEN